MFTLIQIKKGFLGTDRQNRIVRSLNLVIFIATLEFHPQNIYLKTSKIHQL